MEVLVWAFAALGVGILSAVGVKIVDHGPKKMKSTGAWIMAKASMVKNLFLLKGHEKVDIALIALAKEQNHAIAVKKSGYNPIIVTYSTGEHSYHYPDMNSYVKRPNEFEVLTRSKVGKVPKVLSERSISQKKKQLKKLKRLKNHE